MACRWEACTASSMPSATTVTCVVPSRPSTARIMAKSVAEVAMSLTSERSILTVSIGSRCSCEIEE